MLYRVESSQFSLCCFSFRGHCENSAYPPQCILKGLALASSAFILCSCSTVNVPIPSSEPTTVYFAGVSFTGNFRDRFTNYPNSYSLAANGRLDKAFVAELQKHQFKKIILETSLGESTHASDAVSASLGIDLETVSGSHVDGVGYKTVADIYAQVFVFNFDTKKILTSIPINLQYITVTPKRPNREQVKQIFEAMIFGTDERVKESLLELAAKKLETLEVQQDYGTRYKVEKVEFSDQANKTIRSFSINADQFKTITAQMLTRSLADNLNVAVVPYTKGEAIGSKMPARFANGDAFTFELPPADYAFDLKFHNFNTKRNTSNPALDTEAYIVFTNVKFEQPDLQKEFLNRNFRAAATNTLVKGQKSDPQVVYLETIFNFFEGLAKNIEDPETSWLKTVVHPDNVSTTKEQLEAIHDQMFR